MITAKDIADMVERVDAKLLPLCDYEGFEPYEGIYRLGDYGYVTETDVYKRQLLLVVTARQLAPDTH